MMKQSRRKRRARKAMVKERYTCADEAITLKEFNYCCYNCGKKNRLCIDHHRPLSKGNPLTLKNAVVLCVSCNSLKGTKSPETFYGKKKCEKLDKKLKKIALLNKHKISKI